MFSEKNLRIIKGSGYIIRQSTKYVQYVYLFFLTQQPRAVEVGCVQVCGCVCTQIGKKISMVL